MGADPVRGRSARWRRLKTRSHAHVAGRLAGRSVEFDVDVLHVSDQRPELVADGAISLGVHYVMRPASAGSEVEALISVKGGGLLGRVLAKATEVLLAAGALRMSLERIAASSSRRSLLDRAGAQLENRWAPSCGAARPGSGTPRRPAFAA